MDIGRFIGHIINLAIMIATLGTLREAMIAIKKRDCFYAKSHGVHWRLEQMAPTRAVIAAGDALELSVSDESDASSPETDE